MSGGTKSFDQGLTGPETRKLLLRFLLIVISAPLIGWMLSRAWVPGHLLYEAVADLLVQYLAISGGRALQIVGSGLLGGYFGTLIIFLIDIKKRVQGALLLIGTILSLVVLATQNVLVPHLDIGYLPNILAFLLMFAAGVSLDIDKVLSISLAESTYTKFRTENGQIPEFRNAARGLFGALALIILVSLAQVFIAGTWMIWDVFSSGIGIFLLHRFIQYEVSSDYMILGPGKSGKSMAMLGMAMALYDFEDVQPDPNSYLQSALQRAYDPDNKEQWPFEQTEVNLFEASFQMLVGDLFPRRMRLVAFDYPGQLLGDVADRINRMSQNSLSILPFSDSSINPPDIESGEVSESDIVDLICSELIAADLLMVVIDCERLVHPTHFPGEDDNPLGLEFYSDILDNVDIDRVIITATKADVLIHDDQLPVESPEQAGGFAAFKQQVNDMLGERQDIQELKHQLNQTEINPVYFETKKQNNKYIPERDTNNSMIPIGYTELLETIREGY